MIVVYSRPNCPACDVAKNMLKAANRPFTEKDISDPEILKELKTLVPAVRSVPVVVIDGKPMGFLSFKALMNSNDTSHTP